jgi:cytochrome d ubiquinol oxidase subunit I
MAIEFGWIFACTGRQPWVIYRIMSTAESATTATNLGVLFILFLGVYIILGIAVVFVLLYYFRKNTVLDDLERAEKKNVQLFSSNS